MIVPSAVGCTTFVGRPLSSRPLGPGHLHERLAEQELAVGAIEHVHEPVPVGPQHHLARPALPLDVGEHRHLHRVVVELVVRRELEMPFQLTGVGVERDDRFAVQVVAARGGRRSSPAPDCRCPSRSGSDPDRRSRSPTRRRRRAPTNCPPTFRVRARPDRESC